MDISEILDNSIYVLSYTAAVLLLIGMVYLVIRVRRVWQRVILVASSTVLAFGTGFSLWFDLILLKGTTLHHPAIYSPDRRHVAVIQWDLSGAIGFDHVRVNLRSRFSPFATQVYRGIAQVPGHDPEVLWTDNQHLLISYGKNGQIKACDEHATETMNVKVSCRE